MKLFLLIIFIGLVVVGIKYTYIIENGKMATSPSPTPIQKRITSFPTPKLLYADNLFQLVNEWRTKEGYQPYVKSEFACKFADLRIPQVKKNWSHEGFTDLHLQLAPDTWAAENLGKNFSYPSEMLQGWLISPSHRKNLEDSYTHSCIKCDSGYCVHIFTYF